MNSVKSVQISNRVTEFHYSDTDNNNDDDTHEQEEASDEMINLPPPVYPTINNKVSWNKLADKKSTFTKDQIIDLYCANSGGR